MALSFPRARALLVALLLTAGALLSCPNPAAAQQTAPASQQTAPAAQPPAPTLSAQPAVAAVNLTWTEVPDAARYQLIAWWDADTGWQQIGGDNLTAAAFNHTGLTIGAPYYYRIRALDAGGRRGPWSEQRFATPHADLAAPVLSAQPATAAVNLTWTELPGAARYQLIAWWDADTGWQQIGGDNLTAAAYTHTNLTAAATYYYRIRARNAADQPGPWSQQISATLPAAQPSPTPPAATATPTFTPTAAPLSPTSAPTATPTPTPVPAPTATPTTTPAAAQPAPDSSHTLVVSDLQAPVLTARAAAGTVTLSWTPIDAAARYQLTSWTEAGGWQPIGGDNLTATSYNHTGPVASATDFYVRAVSASGDPGPWSEPVSVTPEDTPSPALSESALPAPVLTASPAGLNVHLSWTAVDGAVRYQLVTWTGAAGHVWIGGDNLTATAYDHTGLTAGTTYFYWVGAVSASGQSGPWSQEVSVTVTGLGSSASDLTRTPTAAPTPTPAAAQSSTTPTPTPTATPTPAAASSEFAPPVLTAEARAGAIEVRWNAVPGAVRYKLLTWWDATVGWQDIGGDNLTAATYTHTTAVPGTTYHYAARAVNDAGEMTDWSTYATAVAQPAQSSTSTSTPAATPSVDPTAVPTPTPTAIPYTGPAWEFVSAAHINGFRQGSTVTLSWNPAPGAVHYNIYHCLSVGEGIPVCRFSLFFRSAYELVARDLTATTYVHEGILRPPAGATYAYYYRVQACFIPDCPILTRPTASATPSPTPTPTATPTATPTEGASGLSAPVVTVAAVDGAIEVRWNTVPGAARYILLSWWDANLAWQDIGGDSLTAASFTHTDLTPGLTYYYSVRAVNAAGQPGPWSTYPSIVAPSPPSPTPTPTPRPHVSSPPYWLSLHPYYTKYLDAAGVPVLSSSDVSDEELYQVRDTFLAMLSDRPDILKTMVDHGFRLLIYPLRFEKGGLTSDLPEFRGLGLSRLVYGAAGSTPYGWVAGGPEVARHCNRVMIHEIAHLIEDAIRLQSGGDRFMSQLNSAYQAAMLRGLWQDRYASTNAFEYWAELVLAWLTPSQFDGWLGPGYHKLADYDPVGAALVAEVLGNPTPLTFCEIQRFDLQGTVTGLGSQTPLADSYILQLSMRSPSNGNRLLGTSTSVRRSDRTFSFERLLVEDHFLAAAADKPHIVIGIYRYNSAGNATCPSAAFLSHGDSLVRTTDQTQWKRIQVTGSNITGLAITMPPNFDWTPLHQCI